MRSAVVAMAAVVLMSSAAKGEDDVCRWYMNGAYATEWIDQGEEHGARIVARDPKWQVDDAFAFHSMSHATCRNCLDGQIGNAALWLRAAADFVSIKDLEEAVSPQAVAARMRVSPFGISGAEFFAVSEAVSVSLVELTGRARVINVKYGDGRSDKFIALAVVKGCFSLFGILFAKDGAQVGIDGVEAFASAIGVEFYKPPSNPYVNKPPLQPAPWDNLPLGDAVRRR